MIVAFVCACIYHALGVLEFASKRYDWAKNAWRRVSRENFPSRRRF